MKLKKALFCAGAALFLAAAAFTLFLPFPNEGAIAETVYSAQFGNTLEKLSYAEAFSLLGGVTESGDIALVRGEREGVIRDSGVRAAAKVLRQGSLAELLSLDTDGVSRLGQAALTRAFEDVVYYAAEPFCYRGGIVRKENAGAKALVLLDGALPQGYLGGIETLCLRPDAQFSHADLKGSALVWVAASSPYHAEGGGVYLETAGGLRLLAGLPLEEELSLSYDFADEGALLYCGRLHTLTVPFAGDGHSRGEFALLFSDGEHYAVPSSLKSVKITGGKLVSRAFYGCGGLERIDVCGLSPAEIAEDAFEGLSLLFLHTPREVSLAGEYTLEKAPCGCTVYTRLI